MRMTSTASVSTKTGMFISIELLLSGLDWLENGCRVYYLPLPMLHLATSVARPNLVSLGTCFGKFSKTGKFKLGITCLDYLAKYAKYKVCLHFPFTYHIYPDPSLLITYPSFNPPSLSIGLGFGLMGPGFAVKVLSITEFELTKKPVSLWVNLLGLDQAFRRTPFPLRQPRCQSTFGKDNGRYTRTPGCGGVQHVGCAFSAFLFHFISYSPPHFRLPSFVVWFWLDLC